MTQSQGGTGNWNNLHHLEQRVVYANDTIGAVNVELPIVNRWILRVIESSFAHGRIIPVRIVEHISWLGDEIKLRPPALP